LLAESISLVRSTLSRAIVDSQALEKLCRAAAYLVFSPITYLEFRLAKGESQVDLSQYIPAEKAILESLAAHRTTFAVQPGHYSAWDKLSQFCNLWVDTQSFLNKQVQGIWLEFDVNGTATRIPEPSIFMAFDRALSAIPDKLNAAETGLEILRGQPLTESERNRLKRCFESGSRNTAVIHLGVWLSRPIECLRVIVKGKGCSWIRPYLKQIGWPFSWHNVQQQGSFFFKWSDTITLALDIDTNLHPRIGFEFAIHSPQDRAIGWGKIFDRLVDLQLCDPVKRDACLAWPGWILPESISGPWPQHLVLESIVREPNEFSAFCRSIGHVKLIYDTNRFTAAKAYLSLAHQWIKASCSGWNPRSLQ
jgi:hypothetical protein